MNILIFVSLLCAKQIIEYTELENRSPDDICREYQSNYVWTRKEPCYTAGDGCNYGKHSQEDIEMTGKRVNFFRKLTGLSHVPLTKNEEFLNYVNQASLVMDKNNVFSHELTNKSAPKCWTHAAEIGAANSNIFASGGAACSAESITAYMDDSAVPDLGHRRWVINPSLTQVVSGVAERHSALLIMRYVDNGTEKINNFLSYPPPGPIPHDILFRHWSFSRNYTGVWSQEHNEMPKDTTISVKCNDTIQSLTPFFGGSNPAMYPAMVEFEPGIVPAGTYCKVIISSDSADTEWRYTVLSINCVNGKAQNVNPDAYTGPDNGYGFNTNSGKKKGHGSSHKNDDDDSKSSSKTLGNIEIKSVYLGASPNIYYNFNIFASLMRKARKALGRIVPSPDFVHSAIWVGKDEEVTDDSLGAIFVYGKYWNKHNSQIYLSQDGAKSYVMTLREFKEMYPSIAPMKLDVHKKINLFDFIEKVKLSGKWNAREYNWPTNNCQHFTAKLINILKATRSTPDINDWIELPKPILNSLQLNEEFLNKK